ncbi:unnamed protein product [Lepeophtheirus salmonis]|uniref:(salmon louse) hypothetical protein n=1 Tax=Lepeophtheirus salmonis TaxID=72036 RepID=A0A7R8CU40_LEPSM|nr:unnamed protein product [Lepeophtheirus salmonis]CAF2895183.1 unnamed protein product [Lepeophtheirus salmonis]
MKEQYFEKEEETVEKTTFGCSMKKNNWKDQSKRKNDIKNLCESNSVAATTLKSINRGIEVRPRFEINQPQLLSTILDIVSSSSSAVEKQRTEIIRSVQTLNDLNNKLQSMVFPFSRSSTDLRILSRIANTLEASHKPSPILEKVPFQDDQQYISRALASQINQKSEERLLQLLLD